MKTKEELVSSDASHVRPHRETYLLPGKRAREALKELARLLTCEGCKLAMAVTNEQ